MIAMCVVVITSFMGKRKRIRKHLLQTSCIYAIARSLHLLARQDEGCPEWTNPEYRPSLSHTTPR